MDAQTFLDNFGTIAEAPGGVDRLRELILDLAISGRLVEQRSTEVPVSLRLAEVRAEKGAVLNAKVKGRSKVPREPESWEVPSDTPTGWCWARIDDTGEYVNGLAFKQGDWHDDGLPIIRIQNLTNPNADFNYACGSFPDDRTVGDGDILVSWSATLEAFVWDRGPAVVNQHIFKVIPELRVVAPGFLYHLLRHTIRDLADSDAAHGLAMKHINRGPFVSHVVGIPPLAEQERIVAKVDELMQLCDDLEARQQARHHVTTRLRASSLDALTNAETDDDLHTAWSRINTNWEALTDHPDSIDALRQTILQLAVSGRLSESRSDDEPVATLLNRARAERDRRKLLKLTRLTIDSTNYERDEAELPTGWAWAPLQDIVQFIDYRGKTPTKTEAGVPLITAKNIRRGWINPEPREFVSEATYSEWMTRGLPALGDILFTTEAPLGNAALVDLSGPFALAQRTICFAPFANLHTPFLMYVLLSPWFSEELGRRATGMTATGIKAAKLRLIRVPIPPVEEQQRIAGRVEELMALCDRLEVSLRGRARAAGNLSAAVVQLAS